MIGGKPELSVFFLGNRKPENVVLNVKHSF